MSSKTNGVKAIKGNVKHFGDFPNDVGFSDIPETRSPIELKVTGKIPSYVHGVLYRTGPGSFKTPLKNGQIFTIQHWYPLNERLIDLGLTDLRSNIDSRLPLMEKYSTALAERVTNTSNTSKKPAASPSHSDKKTSAIRSFINSSPCLREANLPPPTNSATS